MLGPYAIAISGMLLSTAVNYLRPIEILTFDELRDRSDVVVIARLMACGDDENIKVEKTDVYIPRRATFEVLTSLKGDVPAGRRLTISFLREKTLDDYVQEAGARQGEILFRRMTIVNGYFLAEIPDYPIGRIPFEPLKAPRPVRNNYIRIPVTRKPIVIREYLLFLKRTPDGNYEPTSGKDSSMSVFELKSTSRWSK